MGCEAQIHEKTDKRGTWSYHSLDGWYLNTSPEHYCVHNCHIKNTKAERLTDTLQFKHKNITNPTLLHTDKLMNALANCRSALMGKVNKTSNQNLKQLQTLVQRVENKLNNEQDVPRVAEPDVPRATEQPVQRVAEQPVPRVPRPQTSTQQIARRAAQQRTAARRRRPQETSPRVHLPTQPPALSTRLRVTASTSKNAPPASHTRNKSRLMQPTSSIRNKRRQANAVHEAHPKKANVIKAIAKLEKQVTHVMAVLDEDSGKLLNYRQLVRHPKYRDEWNQSSANEFGRLGNRAGGRIKKHQHNQIHQRTGCTT
jgi:hypothetical protein